MNFLYKRTFTMPDPFTGEPDPNATPPADEDIFAMRSEAFNPERIVSYIGIYGKMSEAGKTIAGDIWFNDEVNAHWVYIDTFSDLEECVLFLTDVAPRGKVFVQITASTLTEDETCEIFGTEV